MTSAVINILPELTSKTFSGEERAPTGQSGHGNEFQSLMTHALWQSFQHGQQTKTGESIVTKPTGKSKNPSKKPDVSAETLANPSALAEIAALVENSKNLPIIVPSLPISVAATTAKDLSATAKEIKTGSQSLTQILPAQTAMPAVNPKHINPALVANPEIPTGSEQTRPTTTNKVTAEKIQSLAETVSVLPEEIKSAKNALAKKNSPLPLLTEVVPKDSLNDKAFVPAPSESKIQTATKVSPKIHGTVVAQQDVQMKKSEKATEIAGRSGLNEKVLPTKTSVPVEKDLPVEFSVPVHMEKSVRAFVDKIPPALPAQSNTAAAHAVSADAPGDDKLAIEAPVASSTAADTNARAVERTHNLMTMHAIQLRDSNAESLRVVIKPDTGMQLSLELRQRGDGIDARAILQQGDFNQLSQQWPELQQRLEQRGIKLAPLTPDNFSHNDNQSFQHGQQPSAKRELPDELPVNFSFSTAKPKNATHSGQNPATNNRLESWA